MRPRLLVILALALCSAAFPAFGEETLTIRGRVLDPSGKPAPGVDVMLVLFGDVMGMPMPAAKKDVRSDENGAFSISGLPPARYTLAAEKKTSSVFWHGTVDVQPSSDTVVELALHAYSLFEVTVTDGNGAPQPKVEVRLEPVKKDGHSGEAKTDAHGVAHFDALPTGDYRLSARPSKWFRKLEQAVTLSAPDEKLAIHLQAVPVQRGRFVDEHGQPVPQVTFEFFGQFDDKSAADGTFAIPVTDPDERNVLHFGADGHQNKVLELAPGAAVKPLGDVSLPTAKPLTIHVTTADGKPVPHAQAELTLRYSKSPSPWEPPHAEAGDDGVIHIDRYDGSAGNAAIDADGYDVVRLRFEKDSRSLTATLTPSRPPAPRDVALQVEVVDAKGEPESMLVSTMDAHAMTDAQGHAQLQVTGGTQLLTLQGRGVMGYWQHRRVELAAGKPATVRIVLPSGLHTLTVKAPWAQWAALAAGSDVTKDQQHLWAIAPIPTSPLGTDGHLLVSRIGDTFTFKSFAPGPNTLVLIDRQRKPHPFKVELPDSDHTLELPAP